MTKEEIVQTHAANLLLLGHVEGFDAVKSIRTLVQAQLHSEHPAPTTVTDAEILAFHHGQKADPWVKDPLHYAQKKHQSALWVQADALVKEAIG